MNPRKNIEPDTKDGIQHQPVMLEEVLALLQVVPDEDYVDGTLGLGGHAEAILRKSSPEGRLLGIDRDQRALAQATERLECFGPRFRPHHGTYDQIPSLLQSVGFKPLRGMLLDLGVSSLQLEDAGRGFSFLKDSALDKRMDLEEEVTARELLNDLPEKKLEAIFRDYGEERFSRRIARLIVDSRRESPIETTHELAQIVSRAVPFSKKSRIHPATRVFQALRIVVNQELSILEKFLKTPPDFLKTDGVLAIISFHSLEDRIVKRAFRSFAGTFGEYRILTKKPLTASHNEIEVNPRARSAKLRAIQRVR